MVQISKDCNVLGFLAENKTIFFFRTTNTQHFIIIYIILGPISYSVDETGTVSYKDCDGICKTSSICKSFTYNHGTEDCEISVEPGQKVLNMF